MKKSIFPFLLLLWCFYACKKENPSQQGIITFNLNGSPKSVSIPADTLTNTNVLAAQQKEIAISSSNYATRTAIYLTIYQYTPVPGVTNFNIGPYQDFLGDTICQGLSNHVGCNAFLLYYVDANVGAINSDGLDSTAVLNITSFSINPNHISGNFKCQATDGFGSYYQITNGQFSNISFVIN